MCLFLMFCLNDGNVLYITLSILQNLYGMNMSSRNYRMLQCSANQYDTKGDGFGNTGGEPGNH